jgi:hypothetical protein
MAHERVVIGCSRFNDSGFVTAKSENVPNQEAAIPKVGG